MYIVTLKRPVSLNGAMLDTERPLAVSSEEFELLRTAGALASVHIPFRQLLPGTLSRMSWFELRDHISSKIATSKARDGDAFCERFGLAKGMLEFLKLSFPAREDSNGTDH